MIYLYLTSLLFIIVFTNPFKNIMDKLRLSSSFAQLLGALSNNDDDNKKYIIFHFIISYFF